MDTLRGETRARATCLIVTLALLAGVAAGAVLSPAPAYAAADGGFNQRMLQLVNQHRAASNLAPLQWSDGLGRAAADGQHTACGYPVAGRATDMGVRNYFSHTIPSCGNQGFSNVLAALGIQTSGSGENIAWMNGTTDPLLAAERLTNDLMASPGHRANILNGTFTHVGIGSWRTNAGQTWSGGGYALPNVFVGVQIFGRMTSTPTPSLPEAPTAVVATGGDGTIAVSWAPAASGSAVQNYGAFAWDAAGYTGRHAVVCAECRSTTLTGLTNGRAYYVTVKGYNAAGWGADGFSSWVTVAAAPGAPTEVRVLPGNASLHASWRGPSDPGTATDGYGVFVFDADGYTNKYAWVCPTCTTATVTGLVNGRSYYAFVIAHNPNTWGTPAVSDWLVAGSPGPPGNVRATRANAAANASWSLAGSPTAPVDLYGIFAFDANGYTGLYGTACGTCTTGTVPGLVNGRTYVIAVFAHNAHGWGTPVVSGPVTPGAS